MHISSEHGWGGKSIKVISPCHQLHISQLSKNGAMAILCLGMDFMLYIVCKEVLKEWATMAELSQYTALGKGGNRNFEAIEELLQPISTIAIDKLDLLQSCFCIRSSHVPRSATV